MAIQGLPGRPGRFQSNFCFAAFVLPSRQWANCRPDFPNPACTLTPRQWNQSPSRVFQIHLCYAVHGSGNIGRPGLSQSSICFAALVLQSRQWDQLPFRLSQSSSCFALHGSGTNDRPEPYKTSFCFAGHGSGTNSRPGLTQVRLCFATHGSGTNNHPGVHNPALPSMAVGP